MRNSEPGSPVSSIGGRLPAADADAPLTRLFESMRPDLLRFAHWLARDRAIAEDIVQEALLRAWRSRDALKDLGAARPWLLTIVRREHARLYERKRLELAKSMAMQPKVLLLDEVNAGLNASEIDGALRLIRQIAERGVTILIIEHLMKVVLSLASRVLVLHHGQLIAEGSAHDIVQDKRVIEAYLGEKFARRVAAERAHG